MSHLLVIHNFKIIDRQSEQVLYIFVELLNIFCNLQYKPLIGRSAKLNTNKTILIQIERDEAKV